jgi:hypothetical protein
MDEEELKSVSKWTIVYGRRKTGKSFLVQNFIHYDEYFFVNRDRTILSTKDAEKQIQYDTLIEIMNRSLESGKTVVIDEFHRLDSKFFDHIHSMKKSGRLILLTSTLFLAKKLLSENSPLLGLFHEKQIYIIDLNDCLSSLRHHNLKKRELLETAIMLREPINIEYFNPKKSVRKSCTELLKGSVNAVPALMGEIFLEEERGISKIYESIVRAVANGKVVSGEISSSLFSKGLIPKDNPGTLQPYLATLVDIGLLKRIEVYGKNRFVYKIPSPLMRLFFYADEKYGISQRRLTEIEALRIVTDLLPKLVEDGVREHLSYKFGLSEAIAESKDYEIDGLLMKFKKPEIGIEVKWGHVNNTDIRKAEHTLGMINAKRKMLFVSDKTGLSSKVLEIIDVGDL